MLFVSLIIGVSLLLLAIWVLFGQQKSKRGLGPSDKMSLFLVKVKDSPAKTGQFVANFVNSIHSREWNRLLLGEPAICLETAARKEGVCFYISVPRTYESLVEEQLPKIYPDAEIQKVGNVSIFSNDRGFCAGANLISDAQGGFAKPPLKFNLSEDEGFSIQVLTAPSGQKQDDFESNVRILTWANSRNRAEEIRDAVKNFLLYSLNRPLGSSSVKPRRVNGFILDFKKRFFNSRKKINLEPEEIHKFWIDGKDNFDKLIRGGFLY